MSRNIVDRLWGSATRMRNGCLEPPGTDPQPKRYYRGKQWLASRLAYTLGVGPIPDGMCVCHHCDNPRCIRLAHLFVGTQKDNMNDMRRKGRAAPLIPRLRVGRDHHNARLTEDQVKEIRR